MYTLRKGSTAYYDCSGAWLPCKVTSIKGGIVSAIVTRVHPDVNYQSGEPLVSSMKFPRIYPGLAVEAGMLENCSYIED
jgi:hypothetical protein